MAFRRKKHGFAVGLHEHAFFPISSVDDGAQVNRRVLALQIHLVDVGAAQAALLAVAHEVQGAAVGRVAGRRFVAGGVDAAAQPAGPVPGAAAEHGFEQVAAVGARVHQHPLAVGGQPNRGVVVVGVHGRAQVGGAAPGLALPRGLVNVFEIVVAFGVFLAARRARPARGDEDAGLVGRHHRAVVRRGRVQLRPRIINEYPHGFSGQRLPVAALLHPALQVVGRYGLRVVAARGHGHGLGALVLSHRLAPAGVQVQGAGQQVVGARVGGGVELGGFLQVGQGGGFLGRVQVAVAYFHVQFCVVGVELLGGQVVRQGRGVPWRVVVVLAVAVFHLAQGFTQALLVVAKIGLRKLHALAHCLQRKAAEQRQQQVVGGSFHGNSGIIIAPRS